jgi:hypothetical protein
MLMVAHTVLAAVLGSLAPVVAFFALTTTSYSFMIVLTVFSCGIAGLIGIRVFVRALNEPAPEPLMAGPRALTQAPAVPLPALEAATLALPGPADTLAISELAVDPAPLATLPPAPVGTRLPPAPPGVNRGAWQLLGWWVLLYVFVGVETGWILRPFLGHPDKAFVLFRGRSGGFVEGVLHHIWEALSGR